MTEESMVERVARALAKCASGSEDNWTDYMEDARAAIEAMQEPTDAFLHALAERMHDARFSRSGEDHPVARNFIRAFVDAALSEEGAAVRVAIQQRQGIRILGPLRSWPCL